MLKFSASFIILETCQELLLSSSVEQPLSKTLLQAQCVQCLLQPLPELWSHTTDGQGPSDRGTSVPPVSVHVLCETRLIVDLETVWNMKSGGSSEDNEVLCCAEKERAMILQGSFVNGVSGAWDTL